MESLPKAKAKSCFIWVLFILEKLLYGIMVGSSKCIYLEARVTLFNVISNILVECSFSARFSFNNALTPNLQMYKFSLSLVCVK